MKKRLALLESQNTLLLGINARADISQTIYHFVKTCIETLQCETAHIYTLEIDGDNSNRQVKILEHLSIPEHLKIPKLETAILEKIIRKSLNNKVIHTTEYFSFLLGEGNRLVVFENSKNLSPEELNDILEFPILKLDMLCKTLLKINKDAETKIKDNNIANKKQKNEKLDSLTHLPDRRQFKYKLLKTLTNAIKKNHFGAVIYLNIDNFKFINNSLGHSSGDLIITKISRRLERLCHANDQLFRMGGDEFVFIINHLEDQYEAATFTAQEIANQIISQINRPLELGNQELRITSSIGINIFPSKNDIDNDSESILKQANMAMYNAKKNGRNCFTFYDKNLQLVANEQFIIYNQLTTALTNDEFTLVFQPLVDIKQNIIGAEALIRWNNGKLGNVPPPKFIYLAEASDLIIEIGDWVIERACQFIKKIKSLNQQDSNFKYVSINVSPKQFTYPGFVTRLNKKIVESGIMPNDIRLEFTESMLADDIEGTIQIMQQLHNNNIKFLMDDFGTGYSSLSYLYKLPISAIKIDKSFVSSDPETDTDNKVIVDTIIAMSEKMKLKCIVEGVETKESADYFIEKNVYAIQGFYYYKPMPGDKLLEILKNTG